MKTHINIILFLTILLFSCNEEKLNDTNTNLRNVDASDKKIIKIVDFDKEKKVREENKQKKIKVKSF